jgi:hypothetical protein
LGYACSHLDVDIAIEKLKKNKSPGSDQILAELIQPDGETLLSVIHKLINFIWNKEDLPYQSRRVTKLIVIIILGCLCYQLHTKFYRISSSQG